VQEQEKEEQIMATRQTRPSHFGFIRFITAVAIGGVLLPAAAGAQARIWEDRGPVEQLDLYWGNASPERVPVGPFTFVREDSAATNPKAIVRDARGVTWGVKWDDEVRSEVTATRLAWAMGLEVEETYYVETGRIVFAGSRPSAFQRIGSFVDAAGRFKSPARFERRDPDVVSKGRWAFASNPLAREDGYAVLVLMNVVMANWDAKDDNNKIVSVTDAAGTKDLYLIGDYGACFGKMGGEFSHSKYRLKDFAKNPPVVTGVSGRTVHLGYKGKNAEFHESVPLEGARLFASRASQLSLKQVDDAFRAANGDAADREGFVKMVYDRFQQVVTSVR
jgi:hypothetical protein